MGTNQGIYVVELRPSIKGVVVRGWRPVRGRKKLGVEGIPYKLASYLRLMPHDKVAPVQKRAVRFLFE